MIDFKELMNNYIVASIISKEDAEEFLFQGEKELTTDQWNELRDYLNNKLDEGKIFSAIAEAYEALGLANKDS